MARATITRKIQVIASASPGEPLWRQGQAVNTWREIEGSSLSLCPPTVNPGRAVVGPAAKLEAWCGLSIDTRTSTVYSAGNGGHDDYHGNEVNSICLDDDAPQWVENLPSTSGFTIPNNAPRYSDGSPVSIHGYYSQQFIEARNMAMRFGLGGGSSIGNSFGNIDGYGLMTGQWSAAEDFPSLPVFLPDMPVCKDPATEDVYVFQENNAVRKWTQATNAVSTENSSPPDTMTKAASAFDSERGRILLINTRGAWTYDVSTKGFTARTLTGAAASAATAREQNAMVYEPELDAFLMLDTVGTNNVAVYKIDAATFVATALSVTGSPPANPGPNGGGRPYSKFLRVPKHQGCIWFPLYAENGWFLRTH